MPLASESMPHRKVRRRGPSQNSESVIFFLLKTTSLRGCIFRFQQSEYSGALTQPQAIRVARAGPATLNFFLTIIVMMACWEATAKDEQKSPQATAVPPIPGCKDFSLPSPASLSRQPPSTRIWNPDIYLILVYTGIY